MTQPTCTCLMFKNRGYCYHTGYVPVTLPAFARIPDAVKRSQRFVAEHRAKWLREDAEKDKREKRKVKR